MYNTQKPASTIVWGAFASNRKKSSLFRKQDGLKINENK
uniref:Uncharacterized protein n=1 Tax=Lepeophtheirus salmonis TaxID=72036 RepID=A0A0K2U7A9_LEPSM